MLKRLASVMAAIFLMTAAAQGPLGPAPCRPTSRPAPSSPQGLL